MSNPYQSPSQIPGSNYPQQPGQGDATGGMIPYKNPYALISYYTGLFSLLCCLFAVPLGIVPVVLGIIGLMQRAKNPHIKGSAHAWIGIVTGGISTLVSLVFILIFIVALLTAR